MKLEKERLLIIAPHADDEVLGCFGLIDRIKRYGGKVYVQILTLGGYKKIGYNRIKKQTWLNEFLKVAKLLKIDDYDIAFCEEKIRHLDEFYQNELIELFETKSKVSISKLKPTIIAIPTIFSSHQDHIQAYKAAITSLRPHPKKIAHMPNIVLSYESPEYYFWSPYSEFGKFSPNYYLSLSKSEIERKIKVFKHYKSQIRPNQRDGDQIKSLAKIRGSEIGIDYAESYHTHRFVQK